MNKLEPMSSSRHPRHLFPEPRLVRLQLQCHHLEEGEDDLQAAARDQELTDLAEEGDDINYETEHDTRKRKAWALDPIRTVNLIECFQTHLVKLQNQLGNTKYAEIMGNVDVETMDNIKQFVTV